MTLTRIRHLPCLLDQQTSSVRPSKLATRLTYGHTHVKLNTADWAVTRNDLFLCRMGRKTLTSKFARKQALLVNMTARSADVLLTKTTQTMR